jgi:23S rRNA pseudouridine2604 synthase
MASSSILSRSLRSMEKNTNAASEFPMRINKYLAHKGYATRKGADELIEKSRVTINGRVAVLGDKVNESDEVVVASSKRPKVYRYYAYHKPRGVVTHSAQNNDSDIADLIDTNTDLKGTFPVGRLDKDSYGLIILTDDGRVTDRLLNPGHAHDKEYVVTTKESLRSNFKTKMEAGVDIEGYLTKPAKVKLMSEHSFSITLTEGKKHQIRRMVVALFNEVRELKRTRVMNVKLGNLKSGGDRFIEGEELQTFLKKLGL